MASSEDTEVSIVRLEGESMKEWMKRMEDVQYEKKRRAAQEQERQQGRDNKKQKAARSGPSGSVNLSVRGSQAGNDSDGEELTASQLIGMFGARKQPQSKASKPMVTPDASDKSTRSKRKPPTDEYVGFSNEESPQRRCSMQESTTSKKAQPEETNRSRDLTPSRKEHIGAKKLAGPGKAKRSPSDGDAKPKKKLPSGTTANTAARSSAAKSNEVPDTKETSHIRKDSAAEGSTNINGKRSSTIESSRQDNTIGFDKLPKIQKRASMASPQSPDGVESSDGVIVVEKEERPPRWYKIQPMPKTRNPSESDSLLLLQRLTTAISKHDVNTAREVLHKLPYKQVNESLVKGNRMLDNEKGLSLLFNAGRLSTHEWPYDIRADAKELYTKWCRKIFETDLLRGIQPAGKSSKSKRDGGDRNQDSLMRGYAARVDFHAFGDNELSNGQWFPTQLTTVRDGAHGATQGGISGKTGEGAYSCIITGDSEYPNEDRGDEVLYCGTDSDNGTITDRTQLLLDSITNKNSVRLIRRSTLKSEWAPEVGYRYDGLYDVVEYEKLNTTDHPEWARHRFTLKRCAGQDPIRGTGPEKRPTEQEIERYKEDRRFR